MKKSYFFLVLVLVGNRLPAQLFQQDFNSSTVVADYVNAAPGNGQFNAISSSGAGTVVSINTTGSNKLRFARTANAGVFSRTTGFSPAPASLMYRFDVTVSGNGAAATTAAVWQIGSGFGTGNSAEANGAVHSRIGLNFTATAGEFSLRNVGAATNSANYFGTQTITWIVNNAGATINYRAPNGTNASVADDRADIWIGTTLELDEIVATTTTQTLADIKFAFTAGTATVDIDNILIDPIPVLPTSDVANPIGSTSFTTNWTAVSGVTGYRVDVATDAGFTSLVSGYDNLYVAGQSTNSLNVNSNITASTNYHYRIRSASQFTVGEFGSGNSATQNLTTTAGATPNIVVSATSLTAFGPVLAGANSPERTYNVSGTNLADPISVTAPAGVQLSLSSGSYPGTPISLVPAGGTVLVTPIYARFSPLTATGFLSGNISNISTGATTRNISVTGFAIDASPTIQGVITFGAITTTAIDVNFTSGNGAGRILVAKAGSAVDVDPGDGPTYFDGGGIFTNGTDLGGGNYVVYAGSANTVQVSLLTPGTVYHFALYEYNNNGGTVGASNYFTPGSINNTTTATPPLGLQLASANTSYKVTFDNTLAQSNTGSFNGTNINTSGTSGSLNSNAWAINDLSATAAATFGSAYLGNGLQNAGVSSASNFFGMNIAGGNVALGIQPTGAYFSPGNVTLRLQNQTGAVLTKLNLSYTVYAVNDQDRSSSFNFAYSTDNSTYNNQVVLNYTSAATLQNSNLRAQYRSTEITGLSIPNQGFVYLRWYGDDVAGSGSRDEFALDDIDVIANSTSVIPALAGSPENVVINTNTTVTGTITIASDLSLLNGILTLGSNNLNALTVTGGSATSYIRTDGAGTLTVNNITTGKTLPIGNAKYNPVIIENGSGHNWTAKVADGVTADPGFSTNKAVLLTWDITPSVNPPAGPANITFQFDEAATPTGQTGAGFNTGNSVRAWNRSTAVWLPAGSTAGVNTTVPNAATVKINGLSTFSPYALSNVDGPLPVKFTNVKAYQQGTGIKVDWSNSTESLVANYKVERSADGQSFAALSSVNPTLNNGGKADYSFVDDNPINGVNFYRIQSLEVDGQQLYSVIVRVDIVGAKTDVTIYPNPVSGNTFFFQATALPKGQYSIRVINAGGQAVFTKSLQHAGGAVTEALHLPATITAGIYCLQVSDETMNTMRKLIIR